MQEEESLDRSQSARPGSAQRVEMPAGLTKLHVLAWGDDGVGQCLSGARSSADSLTSRPTAVKFTQDHQDFLQIGAGWEQSFLVSGRGVLWAGGSNRAGCLSQVDVEQVFGARPVDLDEAEDLKVAAVDAGREHFVAIQQDGDRLLTWGCSNEFGQTGQGAERVGLDFCAMRSFAVHPGVKVLSVACGQDHALALSERGEVFAWGDGLQGQLGRSMKGDTSSKTAPSPQRVEAGALRGVPVRQISAGQSHSMALGISGQVLTWGCNKHGRLGLGPELNQDIVPLPTLVGGLPNVVRSLSAGGRHSAIVLRKGLVLLTGDNRSGQLGHPPELLECSSSFQEMHNSDLVALQVRSVALGEAHTLFLSYEGELFGVGANDRGQLGEPLAGSIHQPRRVQMPPGGEEWIIWAVAAGPGHTLILASEPPEATSRRPSKVGRMGELPPGRAVSTPDGHLIRSDSYLARSNSKQIVELNDDDDGSPLERTTATVHGSQAQQLLQSADPGDKPADKRDGVSEALPEEESEEARRAPMERLRSFGCSSKLANSGKLIIPVSSLTSRSTSAFAVPSANGDEQVLLRPVVRPGVAAGVSFVSFSVNELATMVKELPEPGADGTVNGSGANKELLRSTMATLLRMPTVLGACFLFPALNEARLNAGGLCEQIQEVRRRLGNALDVEMSWALAAQQGLRALVPPGGLLRNMRTHDQVRTLVTWLLIPNWPWLLEGFPDSGTQQANTAFEVVRELLATLARLPVEGRAALRDILAEECGDAAVLQTLCTTARALANAALRHCCKSTRLETPMWESVLLLQICWLADMRRVEIASDAAEAARAADRPGHVRPGVIGRSLSKTMVPTAVSVMGLQAPAASGVALPRSCFHIDALMDGQFPPMMELRLFAQHAKIQVVDPAELLTDTTWEFDPRQVAMPLAFQSFMANGNLVPVAYKQQVLQMENLLRQQEEQQRAVLNQANGLGGLFSLLPFGQGLEIPQQVVYFTLQVRRDRLLEDTFRALQGASTEELRKPLKVQFQDEEGVDEGGVAREYFRLLSEQLFAVDYGMFKNDSESRYLWFDPGSFSDLHDFEMVGTVIGLAVYNNLPGLDVNFPPALFKKLKDIPTDEEDLRMVFPSHALSLQAVLAWTPDFATCRSEEEASKSFLDTFCLDFSVTYEVLGGTNTANLVGGDGEAPPVTLQRRAEFAEMYKAWYLTTGIAQQFDAFQRGFRKVCGSPIYNCLSAKELEAIVCGEKDLDFEHLKKGAKVVEVEVQFRPGYVEWLWEILDSFDSQQRRQFLKFATGSDLAPIGGLEMLALKIQRNGGEPTNHFPTAQTCFNMVMLPEYESQEKLSRLLLSAIANAEGFGLR